ncbi:uncharacterized protein LOC114879219 isoform X2 [Osmia bicornis bicornis]|uniref:uncharacterized protein LOC114879219 isoform X2 n=1 Tax=Osmia bicornis bicornis TaxID=1437191 RepID=UPI0010F9FABE|nr:uncharacterized protein LOC114879219 isoform X2 [Osmia bicornis bicornis]
MVTKIKMEQVQNDIDNPGKDRNLIEWNLDMKVTVSKMSKMSKMTKKSKMFQRSRAIVLFLLAIIFAVILSHLRKEVRGLQVQMQCMNVNLLLLMSKYDRLNRSLNRAWIQRSEKFIENKNKNMHDIKQLLERISTSKATEFFNDIRRNRSNGTSYTYDSVVSYFDSNNRFKEKYLTNTLSDPTISKKLEDDENVEEIRDDTNLRIERAILTFEKENLTEKETQSTTSNKKKKFQGNDDYVDDDVDDDLDIWREPRAGRWRRDEGRGPLVATFIGAIPEQHVTDTVYIGPWVKSTKNNTQYSLNKFHLVEDKKSIEVTVTGLYMISAQIFYFGEPTNYSYWILLSSEGKSTTRKLVKCSTASSTSATEVSCYTSVITPLQRGDRVHIQQQEKNRLINMREGHSYIQLVLLSNNTNHKRRSR